jgi:hypothetical protein
MADINRKIDEILGERLSKPVGVKASDGFTSMLMKRVQEEHLSAREEVRRDRIAKYIVWGFIALTISVIIITAYAASAPDNDQSLFVRLSPEIETSENLMTDITSYIQSFAGTVLGLFGISITPQTLLYIFGFIFLIGIYLLGDKLLIRSRLKSNQV